MHPVRMISSMRPCFDGAYCTGSTKQSVTFICSTPRLRSNEALAEVVRTPPFMSHRRFSGPIADMPIQEQHAVLIIAKESTPRDRLGTSREAALRLGEIVESSFPVVVCAPCWGCNSRVDKVVMKAYRL
ncbi:unnamed protein product [Scytosiphon promiscuus]